MIKNVSNIKIGFFKNFEGKDSLLFDCTSTGLLHLKSIFTKLSLGQIKEISLERIPDVDALFNFPIKAKCNVANELIITNGYFSLELDKTKWLAIATQLDSLSPNKTLVLNNVNEKYQIIFSSGVYTDAFWEKHKEEHFKSVRGADVILALDYGVGVKWWAGLVLLFIILISTYLIFHFYS